MNAVAAVAHTGRKTRIVATIGPASSTDATLEALVAAGMDAARVNFSHGVAEEQAGVVRRLRALGRRLGRPMSVIADLPGPKLRVATLAAPLTVKAGSLVTLGDGAVLPVTDPSLLAHLRPGDRVLVDDGALALTVEASGERRAGARALNSAVVVSNKGVNLPDTRLPIRALTARDLEVLPLALDAGADHIAQSFVRSAKDVAELRAALRETGSSARIIAKIEKAEALGNLGEIIRAADAVMVARGDLGVEIPPAQVPLWQKAIITAARRAGRPVITATQMLQSMVVSPRPTRAEASDVANAILDSTDAVMLSAETAIGDHPVAAVETMADIAAQAERGLPGAPRDPVSLDVDVLRPEDTTREAAIVDAISLGACSVARGTGAVAIVTSTVTGRTAQAVARLRPSPRLVALSADRQVLDQLALCWGVTPLPFSGDGTFDDIVREADELLVRNELCRPGDLVVITAGAHGYAPGTTNLIKAHIVR